MLVTKFGLYKLLSSRKLPRLMDVLNVDGDTLLFFSIRIQARHGRKLDMFSTKVCMVSQRKRLDVLDWYLEQESG